MLKDLMHCKTITRVPVVATTGAALKFEYLGDFVEYMERLRRSAAWGIAWPKDFTGTGGT